MTFERLTPAIERQMPFTVQMIYSSRTTKTLQSLSNALFAEFRNIGKGVDEEGLNQLRDHWSTEFASHITDMNAGHHDLLAIRTHDTLYTSDPETVRSMLQKSNLNPNSKITDSSSPMFCSKIPKNSLVFGSYLGVETGPYPDVTSNPGPYAPPINFRFSLFMKDIQIHLVDEESEPSTYKPPIELEGSWNVPLADSCSIGRVAFLPNCDPSHN